MGIDLHALNFVQFASSRQNLGSVAMIGRQRLAVPEVRMRELLHTPEDYQHPRYCEDLLVQHFGATSVESFDNSAYEGATHIADFNLPISIPRQYDTVMDVGSLEHIFNAPQALMNVSALCRKGGQILHVLPSNNWCGHGLWQFSPELFLSLYSAENGYSDTQVFMADLQQEEFWYEVLPPKDGEQVVLASPNQTYVMCRTIRGDVVSTVRVQQSMYMTRWAGSSPLPPPESPSRVARVKAAIRHSPAGPLARRAVRWIAKQRTRNAGVASTFPDLVLERRVSELTHRSGDGRR